MVGQDKQGNVSLKVAAPLNEAMAIDDKRDSPSPKIAYVLGNFPSLSTTFITQEILELERQGLQLHLFTLTEPSESEKVKEAPNVKAPIMCLARLSWLSLMLAVARCWFAHPLRFLYAITVFLARYRQKTVLRHLVYASYLAKQLKQTGIVHLHAHFATSPTSVAQAASLLTGVPYSFMAHAFDIYLSPEAELRFKMGKATFVATCSHFTRTYLATLVDESVAKRIHCIYVGLDLKNLPAGTLAEPVQPPLILTVARLIEKKGLSYLLRACKILKDQHYDFTCRIVGDGPMHQILEQEINELELTEKVEMWGAETNEGVLKMYQQATIMTLPCVISQDGDRDGLPRVLAEALYMGVPVVSTPVSGIPELITSEITGLLVPQRDSDALAAALARLLDDPTLRDRLASAGQQAVIQQFDLARNIGFLRYLLCK